MSIRYPNKNFILVSTDFSGSFDMETGLLKSMGSFAYRVIPMMLMARATNGADINRASPT